MYDNVDEYKFEYDREYNFDCGSELECNKITNTMVSINLNGEFKFEFE